MIENLILQAQEEELNKGSWLTGDNFSLADIAIAPFIERFEANNLDELIDFRKRPKIGSWWKKIKSRDSFRTTYAFKNPDD